MHMAEVTTPARSLVRADLAGSALAGLARPPDKSRKSLHVAVVQRLITLRKGGAERYCVNICRSLHRLGHRVTIIGEWIDPSLADEFQFVPVAVNRATSWTKNRSFARAAFEAFSASGYDVTLGLGLVPGVDVARATGRIHAHWMRVRFAHGWQRRIQALNPRHRAILDLEQALYGTPLGAHRIIAQSNLEARLLRDWYGAGADRTHVIHNGVDHEVFHAGLRREAAAVRALLGTPPESPLVVFAAAGNLLQKGLLTCLAMLRRTRRRDVRLLVLGGEHPRALRGLARAMGVGDQVIFLGARPAVERFFAAADLLVLPTAYEPFPNVNLEAMACGTPVVTTATCGAADLVRTGENGYLIKHAGAADDFASAIDDFFSLSTNARETMRDACCETAGKLSLERNARLVADLLHEVAAVKQSPRINRE